MCQPAFCDILAVDWQFGVSFCHSVGVWRIA